MILVCFDGAKVLLFYDSQHKNKKIIVKVQKIHNIIQMMRKNGSILLFCSQWHLGATM